jgi:hypothetical protein
VNRLDDFRRARVVGTAHTKCLSELDAFGTQRQGRRAGTVKPRDRPRSYIQRPRSKKDWQHVRGTTSSLGLPQYLNVAHLFRVHVGNENGELGSKRIGQSTGDAGS